MKKMYGNFPQLSNKFSYLNKNRFVSNELDCFRRYSPSLARIDIAYGKGSAASWLFSILQGMFVFLGVTEEKFGKEQIYNLACNISNQYKTLKVVEILLFVSRFESGKYGRFYGGDSYALVVTEAINQFMEERYRYYEEIEKEKERKTIESWKKNAMTFEEYKKMKESRGEKISKELESFLGND